MKQLIVRADGEAVKSKIGAIQVLNKLGIAKELLFEENGQFCKYLI